MQQPDREVASGVIEHMSDGFFVLDREWRFTYLNRRCEEIMESTRLELLGARLFEKFPEVVGSSLAEHCALALKDGEPASFEEYFPQYERWFEFRLHPFSGGLAVLFLDITERKRAEQELGRLYELERQARIVAQEALDIRDSILASISHDLKNPLTSIKALAQSLERRTAREQQLEPDHVLQVLGRIEAAVRRMTGMVNELADLSRLGTGEPERLEVREEDLLAIVVRAVEDVQQTISSQEIRLEAPAGELIGAWDPAAVERVVVNVLSNAVKYSPEASVISVGLARESGARGPVAVLTVRDEGIGIPKHELPHVFEPYFRGSNVSGSMPGTGVGLTGVKRIVEQHGGEVRVESGEGKGTLVTIRLPLKCATAGDEAG